MIKVNDTYTYDIQFKQTDVNTFAQKNTKCNTRKQIQN